MIFASATIEKSQIEECHSLIGAANRLPIFVDGSTYVRGALAFRGFAGAIDLRDKLYHGTFAFDAADDDVTEYFDTLPAAGTVTQEEDSDGV